MLNAADLCCSKQEVNQGVRSVFAPRRSVALNNRPLYQTHVKKNTRKQDFSSCSWRRCVCSAPHGFVCQRSWLRAVSQKSEQFSFLFPHRLIISKNCRVRALKLFSCFFFLQVQKEGVFLSGNSTGFCLFLESPCSVRCSAGKETAGTASSDCRHVLSVEHGHPVQKQLSQNLCHSGNTEQQLWDNP